MQQVATLLPDTCPPYACHTGPFASQDEGSMGKGSVVAISYLIVQNFP